MIYIVLRDKLSTYIPVLPSSSISSTCFAIATNVLKHVEFSMLRLMLYRKVTRLRECSQTLKVFYFLIGSSLMVISESNYRPHVLEQ